VQHPSALEDAPIQVVAPQADHRGNPHLPGRKGGHEAGRTGVETVQDLGLHPPGQAQGGHLEQPQGVLFAGRPTQAVHQEALLLAGFAGARRKMVDQVQDFQALQRWGQVPGVALGRHGHASGLGAVALGQQKDSHPRPFHVRGVPSPLRAVGSRARASKGVSPGRSGLVSRSLETSCLPLKPKSALPTGT